MNECPKNEKLVRKKNVCEGLDDYLFQMLKSNLNDNKRIISSSFCENLHF